MHHPNFPTLKQQIRTTCNEAWHFIASQQQSDGGFVSSDTQRSSVFYTGLIVSILHTPAQNMPLLYQLPYAAVDFLLSRKSPQWSFRYTADYPDDLDDTAIVLRALYISNPSIVTEEVLAHFVATLISNETTPGGPYQTWIMSERTPAWDDIDIVVNSNIARCLADMDIAMPMLQAYVENCIEQGMYRSRYYYDEIIVIYFLSAAYTGNARQTLIDELLSRQQPDGCWENPLFTAMAVSALLRLGADHHYCDAAIASLLTSHTNGRWPSQAIFIASKSGDNVIYSSCDAYVSACCIEALLLYEGKIDDKPRDLTTVTEYWITDTFQACRNLFSNASPLLQTQLDHALTALSAKDPKGEIPLLSYHMRHHLDPRYALPKDMALQLAVMNTFGWIGYSICDAIVDGEAMNGSLPLALRCIHEVISTVRNSISAPRERSIAERILHDISAVTAWEHDQCKFTVTDDGYDISILPEYDSYQCLAEKSLGHALGPIMISFLCQEYTQAVLIENFFRHYLIARQLNDDAHDWLEDLQHGYVNSVSVDILRDWKNTTGRTTMVLAEAQATLQQLFWDIHIDRISSLILEQCTMAREILKKITIVNEVTFLEALLIPLERAAQTAIDERNSTRSFLASFAATALKT